MKKGGRERERKGEKDCRKYIGRGGEGRERGEGERGGEGRGGEGRERRGGKGGREGGEGEEGRESTYMYYTSSLPSSWQLAGSRSCRSVSSGRPGMTSGPSEGGQAWGSRWTDRA